jgi:predicted dehydrogenase
MNSKGKKNTKDINPKKKLGIALLGLGEYATKELAPALQETNECYLAGIITDSKDKAKDFQKKYNIADKSVYNYQTFDSIKDNSDIDIVYVVSPNSLHPEHVMRAARAGKHIICEKPLAITIKDCDEMIDACKKAGVTLSVGYRLHFEPHNLKMMELGNKKIYGDIKKIIAKHGMADVHGWRIEKDLAGGGPLMDLGVYCIQAVRYTTGTEPVAVTAQEGPKTNPKKFKDVEQSLIWQMEMPDGMIAECACSYSEQMDYLKAEAQKGWFELDPAFAYGGLKGKTSDGEMNIKNINQQAKEMDDISIAIKTGKPSIVSGEMGRQDVKILQAIYAAMKSGKRVKIE